MRESELLSERDEYGSGEPRMKKISRVETDY
jgi:hypothetical protein